MTRTLVTGGAGFIGSHLCDRLVQSGHDVIVLDNLTSGSQRNLEAVADQITFIKGDVRDIRDHASALKGVELIFHLAALISGYDSLKEPEEYIAHNLVG